MEKAERIKVFKGTLDSINLFIKLLEEDVPYDVQYSQSKNQMYYKIIQRLRKYWKVEYHVEYLVDYNITRLDIHCDIETGKEIKDDVLKTLKPSGKIKVEKFKNSVTFNSFFKFEDLNQINSIAMLMIELNKE